MARDTEFGQQVVTEVMAALKLRGWHPDQLAPGIGMPFTGTAVLRVSKEPVSGWPPDSETVYFTMEAADRSPQAIAEAVESFPETP